MHTRACAHINAHTLKTHTCESIHDLKTTLQHHAPHCNTPLRAMANRFATTLPHTATHGNTLQHTATYCHTVPRTATHCNVLQHTATHPHDQQPTASQQHCNTLQHSTEHTFKSSSQQLCNLTATHCNTLHHLQHTATHYNTHPQDQKSTTPQPHCNTQSHAATHCPTLQHIPLRTTANRSAMRAEPVNRVFLGFPISRNWYVCV